MIASHLLLAASLTVSGTALPSTGLPDASLVAAQASEAGARRVLNRFARCLAKERPGAARAVFALPTGSPEQQAAAAQLLPGVDRCGPNGDNEVELSGLGLIGGLAEGLLDAQRQGRNMAALASWNDQAIERSVLRPRNVNEDMGLCVVRRAPQQTQRLLGSTPGTAAEERAVRALVPHLGPCAPAGAKLTFDTPTIRDQIAIASYRAAAFLSTAASTAPVSPK